VYEENAHRLGHATRGRYFPYADRSIIAGNYVVWRERGQSLLHWQTLLGTGKESQALDLLRLVRPARYLYLSSLHVNENGLLHVGLAIRSDSYCDELNR